MTEPPRSVKDSWQQLARVAGSFAVVVVSLIGLVLALTLGRGLEGKPRSAQIPPAAIGVVFALAALVIAARSHGPGPIGPLWLTTAIAIAATFIGIALSAQ
jgi:hypothetical protein